MDDQDDAAIEALPATPSPADPLAFLTELLATVNSARQVERRVREIRRETATARAAQSELAAGHAELAAARAELEQYKAELAKIQVLADRAQVRMDVAEATEDSFAERERRIHEKEQHWKFTDEDEDVRRGFREPENGTGLEKARKAYGLSDDAVDTSVPMPSGNDADFSSGLPPDATIARAASARPRSQRVRTDQ
jgi:multidrug efflux pump subunit AcrA (membrane-fusion protein)